MNPLTKYKHHKRVKLIFNPASGTNKKAPILLTDIIQELQYWRFISEPFITEPDTDYAGLVRDAMKENIRMFVVCGGDGTVSSVARNLFGTKAVLGIIPMGTQNNVATSLGIPPSIKESIKLLRTGKQIKSDMGIVKCGETNLPFVEVCSIGLFSALFQSGDEIQHGDISRIGDFLATFSTSEPSKIHLILDNKTEVKEFGHVVMISNMPLIGRRYKIGHEKSYCDGLLDVLLCSDISKLNIMLNYILKKPDVNGEEDYRLKRFRVKSIQIKTTPVMPVMVDGIILKGDFVIIEIRHKVLNVIAGSYDLDEPREIR